MLGPYAHPEFSSTLIWIKQLTPFTQLISNASKHGWLGFKVNSAMFVPNLPLLKSAPSTGHCGGIKKPILPLKHWPFGSKVCEVLGASVKDPLKLLTGVRKEKSPTVTGEGQHVLLGLDAAKVT